jgi:hypothetical protein
VSELDFKPNDVLSYRYDGRYCEMICHHTEGGQVYTAAARCIGAGRRSTGEWEFYDEAALLASDGTIEDLRLHPNPDEVWASYCAAMLRA